MRNHLAARLAAAAAGLTAAAAMALAGAGIASAATTANSFISSNALVGYTASGHNSHFRYAAANFTVPENACVKDDFQGADVQLGQQGSAHWVTLGVRCYGSIPEVGYQFYSFNNPSGFFFEQASLLPSDTVHASIYDQGNGYDEFVFNDSTTPGLSFDVTHYNYGAHYNGAAVFGQVQDPAAFQPAAGTNAIDLLNFSKVNITTYSGSHSTAGLKGWWGNGTLTDHQAGNLIAFPSTLSTSFSVVEQPQI